MSTRFSKKFIDLPSMLVVEEMKRLSTQDPKQWATSPLVKILNADGHKLFSTAKTFDELMTCFAKIYPVDELRTSTLENLYEQSFSNMSKSTVRSMLKWFEDYNKNQAKDWAQDGTHVPITDGAYLMLLQCLQETKLPPFVFLAMRVTPGEGEKKLIDILCRGLYLSRIHFLLKGKHLPIIVSTTLHGYNPITKKYECAHATSMIYLPYTDEEGHHVFRRIFVDTSAAVFSLKSCEPDAEVLRRVDRDAFKQFIASTKRFQSDCIYRTEGGFCTSNIQKAYSTCATWNFALTIFFLSNWKKIISNDRQSTSDWCEALARKTKLTSEMDKYMEMLLDIRKLFTSYFYDIIVEIDDEDEGDAGTVFLERITSNNTVHKTAVLKITVNLLNRIMKTMESMHPLK